MDHIATAELNNNGDIDLIGASSATSTVVLFFGNPGIALATPVVFPVGNSPTGIAVGDLNGDGHPDLVTANTVDNTIQRLAGFHQRQLHAGSCAPDFSVGTLAAPRRARGLR